MRKALGLALIVGIGIGTTFAATNYVSLTGTNAYPYDSWASAATNIQTAVDISVDGDVVLVGTGTYLNTAPFEAAGSMIVITNGITLAGAYGPSQTVIDARRDHQRCIYLSHPDARVVGLTISQGRPGSTNMAEQAYPIACGGGVLIEGSGTVERCIIRDNVAWLAGAGAWLNNGGTLRNCLIVDNEAVFGGGVYCTNGGVVESCTIVRNRNDTNLLGGISCINGGAVTNSILWANSNAFNNAVDVYTEGSNWSFAYCRVPPGIDGTENISNDPGFVDYTMGNFRLAPSSPCDGEGTNLPWMTAAFDLDGNPRISKGTVDMGAYETPGVYYVATNGMHVSPFTTWTTAATNIESALAVAFPTTVIIVSNGVYQPATVLDLSTNLTVRSVNGATATTIMGGLGQRCASLRHTDAVLDGFTLTGANLTNASGSSGGGASINAGTVRNCIVRGNRTVGLGGGVEMKAGTVLENTVVSDNYSDNSGGGGVIVMGNGTLRNCLIVNNATKGTGSFSSLGGGGVLLVSGGTLDSCTIAQNTSGNNGGGVLYAAFGPSSTSVVRNTIVAHNVAAASGSNYFGTLLRFEYSCTEPTVSAGLDGGGNIATDPKLIAPVPGIFRLGYSSPCIDTGSNMAWMTGAVDMLNLPRIARGAVDMGAYEVPAIHFVATNGLHVAPFTNWINAATSIVAAVAEAGTGSVVAVDGGMYVPGGEMQIQKPIAVQGVPGWSGTVVNGNGGVGRFSVRSANAVIDGFTITNCTAPGGGMGPMGGGAVMDPGIIQNCLLAGNGAGALGAGLMLGSGGGMAYLCRIMGNIGTAGGGVMLLGGLGKLWNCQVDHNVQTGVFMVGMVGIAGGAGVISVGGGEIANCTITANTSSNSGGGIMHMGFGPFTGPLSVINSIVYGNTAGDGSSNYYHAAYNAQWRNSSTEPAFSTNVLDAGGNVFVDPQLIYSNGTYQIPPGSPCEDKGTNLAWSAFATDLVGAPRMSNGTVDMGSYEVEDIIPEPMAALVTVIGYVVLVMRRRIA